MCMVFMLLCTKCSSYVYLVPSWLYSDQHFHAWCWCSSYSAPLADPTLTLHNVMRVVEGVRDWETLAAYAGVPESTRLNIKRRYSTKDDQKKAVWEYFLACAPNATWQTIAGQFYFMKETTALERARKYFQRPSGTDTITIVVNYVYFSQ